MLCVLELLALFGKFYEVVMGSRGAFMVINDSHSS